MSLTDYTEMRQSADPVLHGRYVAALETQVDDLVARVAELEAPRPTRRVLLADGSEYPVPESPDAIIEWMTEAVKARMALSAAPKPEAAGQAEQIKPDTGAL